MLEVHPSGSGWDMEAPSRSSVSAARGAEETENPERYPELTPPPRPDQTDWPAMSDAPFARVSGAASIRPGVRAADVVGLQRLGAHRRGLLASARGDVLKIGGGTGAATGCARSPSASRRRRWLSVWSAGWRRRRERRPIRAWFRCRPSGCRSTTRALTPSSRDWSDAPLMTRRSRCESSTACDAGGTAPLHRARPCRGRGAAGALAGPHAADRGPHGPWLPVQPADRRRHPKRPVRRARPQARRAEARATVRAAVGSRRSGTGGLRVCTVRPSGAVGRANADPPGGEPSAGSARVSLRDNQQC